MDWHTRVAKIEEINLKIKIENPKQEGEREKKYKQRLKRLFRQHCKTIPKCRKCRILLLVEQDTNICPNCLKWSKDGFSYQDEYGTV